MKTWTYLKMKLVPFLLISSTISVAAQPQLPLSLLPRTTNFNVGDDVIVNETNVGQGTYTSKKMPMSFLLSGVSSNVTAVGAINSNGGQGTNNGFVNVTISSGNGGGLTNVSGTNIVGQITTINSPDSAGRMQLFNPSGFLFGNNSGGSQGAMILYTNTSYLQRLFPTEMEWFVYQNGGSPDFSQRVDAAYYTGSGGTLNDLPSYNMMDAAMPVPFLGWNSFIDTNSYNGFPAGIPSGAALTNVITTWKTNGLFAAGYNTVWFDDSWQSNAWVYDGSVELMQPNPTYFPDTMQHYTAYAHANGFKIFIYTTDGPVDCAGLPGTPFESIPHQAQQFSDWGFDGVKLDRCNHVDAADDVAFRRAWAWALAQMVWHNGTTNHMSLLTTATYANTGEINSPDVVNSANVLENSTPGGYPVNNDISTMPLIMVVAQAKTRNNWAQRVGHWNELSSGGEGRQSRDVKSTNWWQTYVTMNSMLSSPMYTAIGNGTFTGTSGPGYSLPFLTNQDALYLRTNNYTPATIVFSNALAEVWLKPFFDKGGNPASAVVLANMSSSPQSIAVNFDSSAGQVIPSQTTNRWVIMHDVWANTNTPPTFVTTGNNTYSFIVQPTNVTLLMITNYYPAGDYSHNGTGLYAAGPTTLGGGLLYLGDNLKTDHPQVVDGAGILTLSANDTQWNNQVNSAALMKLDANTHTLSGQGTLIQTNMTDYYGSGGGISNATASIVMGKLMPTPIMLYSSFVDLFDGTNAIPSETWVTNVVNLLNGLRFSTTGCTNIALEDQQYQALNGTPSGRNSTGGLVANTTNFPNGFPYITSFAKNNGFNMSSYLSRTKACSWIPFTTPQTEAYDVLSNQVWGFSGMIFDECNFDTGNMAGLNEAIRIYDEATLNAAADSHTRLTTNHGMWLIKTQNWTGYGDTVPWESMLGVNIIGVPGGQAGTVSSFASVADVLLSTKQQEAYSFYISPGHYVDPTSFSFQNTKYIIRQILSAYAMCSSPIQIGRMSTPFEDFYNSEWRQVWQDPLCQCAYPIYSNNLAEVHLKPRVNGQYSLLFFNSSNTPQTITISNTQMGLPYSAAFTARDPWNYTNITTFNGSFTWTVPGTNCYLINLTPVNNSVPFIGPTIPPAQVYPPYFSLMWVSNNPSYYSGRNVYLLQNNQTGNNWESQTLIAQSANANYTPNKNLTNAIFIYDVPSMGLSNNTLMTFMYDRGSNNYTMLQNNDFNLFGPFITNNNSFLGGKSWAFFSGTNGYGGTWNTGMSTNFVTTPTPGTSPLSIFMVCTLGTNQVAGNHFRGLDGNNTFFNDGIADPLFYFNGGSGGGQQSFQPRGPTNAFQVVEIYNDNTAGSYIKTNGVQASTGTAFGNNPLHGLMLGARDTGNQNQYFNMAWLGAFTNMSSADRTSLTTWLMNWTTNGLPTQQH